MSTYQFMDHAKWMESRLPYTSLRNAKRAVEAALEKRND